MTQKYNMFSLHPILFSLHPVSSISRHPCVLSLHPFFSLGTYLFSLGTQYFFFFLGGGGGGKRKVCTSGPPYIVQARRGRKHRGVKECRRVPAAPPATLLTTSRASEVPDQKMCLLCLPLTPPGLS